MHDKQAHSLHGKQSYIAAYTYFNVIDDAIVAKTRYDGGQTQTS